MKTNRKEHRDRKNTALAFLSFMCLSLGFYSFGLSQPHVGARSLLDAVVVVEAFQQLPEESVNKTQAITVENLDLWVGNYTDRYFESRAQRSEVRALLHCLLNRESKHGADSGHGDGGKAGGPLQYHQPTWESYRKLMIKEGLVTEIGSRYDMEQAIHTTVWAISTNRAKAWGPVYRDMKGSDYATCQTPSWY